MNEQNQRQSHFQCVNLKRSESKSSSVVSCGLF